MSSKGPGPDWAGLDVLLQELNTRISELRISSGGTKEADVALQNPLLGAKPSQGKWEEPAAAPPEHASSYAPSEDPDLGPLAPPEGPVTPRALRQSGSSSPSSRKAHFGEADPPGIVARTPEADPRKWEVETAPPGAVPPTRKEEAKDLAGSMPSNRIVLGPKVPSASSGASAGRPAEPVTSGSGRKPSVFAASGEEDLRLLSRCYSPNIFAWTAFGGEGVQDDTSTFKLRCAMRLRARDAELQQQELGALWRRQKHEITEADGFMEAFDHLLCAALQGAGPLPAHKDKGVGDRSEYLPARSPSPSHEPCAGRVPPLSSPGVSVERPLEGARRRAPSGGRGRCPLLAAQPGRPWAISPPANHQQWPHGQTQPSGWMLSWNGLEWPWGTRGASVQPFQGQPHVQLPCPVVAQPMALPRPATVGSWQRTEPHQAWARA